MDSLAFSKWLDDFFTSYYRNHPVNATSIGTHGYDHKLPDFGKESVAYFLVEMEQLLRRLRTEVPVPGLDTGDLLDAPQEIDHLLAENCYNIYLGNYRSIIEVNTPLLGFNLIPLMCPEAYAGHHVERAMKEKLLYKGRGFGEHAVFVWRSPENLVANGIGNNATMVLFGEEGMQEWLAENIYPDAGIEALDVTTEVKVARAMAKLSGFRAKAAMIRGGCQSTRREIT